MPKICAVTTAVPEYCVTQDMAEGFARSLFSNHVADLDRLLPIFVNSGIDKRYLSAPLDWFCEPHSLEEKNQRYVESATELSCRAVSQLMETCSLRPGEIDYLIFVNTTGIATPSIDARIINKLNLRDSIRRTPIWGLGCAGGAAGISHAFHYALGHPEERIVVVAAELCGLTFVADDFSKSNLVASALFGEGAAAVLITGDDIPGEGLDILATNSRFYPDSLDVMGWSVVSKGLQVVFAQRIPRIVRETSREDLTAFLGQHSLSLADIEAFIFHPGGTKVIEAYEEALALSDGQLALSRGILRDYGNMSSVTVMFVLERFMQDHRSDGGGHGLISALGPGFCSESVLLGL